MRPVDELNVTQKKITKFSGMLIAVFALAIGYFQLLSNDVNKSIDNIDGVGHADIDTLKLALNSWRTNYEAKGGSPELLKLSLGYSKVLSKQFTQAHGRMQFNLKNGELIFQATGLDVGEYDLWLLDNLGGSVLPEAGDKMLHLGRFAAEDGKGRLETKLERSRLLGLSMDTIVVSKAGESPVENVTIAGAPDLMLKLYYADKPWLTTAMGDFKDTVADNVFPFEFLLPKAANAGTLSDLTPVLGALVAKGRHIFHNETFAGNGRTCGTCHREDNNFTLDPNYIMNLPARDPLFVAETNPALAELENPVLMRKHGLILTNVDGPNVDIFRSVPHTLALSTTIARETIAAGGEFEADEDFAHATGWSGDGAPGSGSLREFTEGAIKQHMPRTMNRIAGSDFRLPSDAELDAVEAYMLSLGRSKDYPVYQISFNDPLVESGKVLFDTKTNPVIDGEPAYGETANCNGCHQNAGGRSSSTKANPTRNTGVENMKIHPARLLQPDMAYDGGFGVTESACGPHRDQICYGDGRFNTPPLIEAADTPPFFHNNAVSTLEEAIAAYNSEAFNASPGSLSKDKDRSVKLDSTQVVALASFLRALNALENIRQSDKLDNQAMRISNNATARELARLGRKENQDAIRVLKEGVLGNNWKAVRKLEKAEYYQGLALIAPVKAMRNRILTLALDQKVQARALMATCDPSATPAPTVVVPPADMLYSCSEIGL